MLSNKGEQIIGEHYNKSQPRLYAMLQWKTSVLNPDKSTTITSKNLLYLCAVSKNYVQLKN